MACRMLWEKGVAEFVAAAPVYGNRELEPASCSSGSPMPDTLPQSRCRH